MKELVGIVVLTLGFLNSVDGNAVAEKDLTLSATEKSRLDQFKVAVEPLINGTRFASEAYLIRWLRAAKFDVSRAERLLNQNLKWRKTHNMDTIHQEDWSDLTRDYPYYLTVDKESQPVVLAPLGSWDFRQAWISGKAERVSRYLFKMLDEADLAIYKQQQEGKLVTRAVYITNVQGYNLVQHFCAGCIPIYLQITQGLDAHYPSLYNKIFLVNAPSLFETLLNIIKNVMSSETRDILQVYGSNNRHQMESHLLTFIDRDQLSADLGGDMVNPPVFGNDLFE